MWVFSLACCLGFQMALIGERKVAPGKPNVILIVADDLGWSDLGCQGSAFYKTPNIDRLAQEGMRFPDAYAAPSCSPSRASIMTGKEPARLHLMRPLQETAGPISPAERGKDWPWHAFIEPIQVPALGLEEVTIAERLKSAGYDTAMFGKWHLGGEGFGPEEQGFDVVVGGGAYAYPKTYFSPYRMEDAIEDGPEGEYLTDRLVQEAIQYLQAPRANPFFIYLSFFSPHTPLMGKPEKIAAYEQAADPENPQHNPVYAAMIDSLDENIGLLLDALDGSGSDDSTLVIFVSDNGGVTRTFGGNEYVTSNLPLRGGKGTLWEGGVRVPLIIRWPRRVAPGSICSTPVALADFYPTLCELAGVDIAPSIPPLSTNILYEDSFELDEGELHGRRPDAFDADHDTIARWKDEALHFRVTNGVLQTVSDGLASAWLALPDVASGDVIRVSSVLVPNGNENTDWMGIGLLQSKNHLYQRGEPYVTLARRAVDPGEGTGLIQVYGGLGNENGPLFSGNYRKEQNGFTTNLNARNTVGFEYDTASGNLQVWLTSEGGTTVTQYSGSVDYGGVAGQAVPLDELNYAGLMFKSVTPMAGGHPAFLDDLVVEVISQTNVSNEIDGKSLVPLLANNAARYGRNSVFGHLPYYNRDTDAASYIRTGNMKLIKFYRQPVETRLFNLEQDIGETNNLVDEHPELAAQMEQSLEAWLEGVGAWEMVENPNYDPAMPPPGIYPEFDIENDGAVLIAEWGFDGGTVQGWQEIKNCTLAVEDGRLVVSIGGFSASMGNDLLVPDAGTYVIQVKAKERDIKKGNFQLYWKNNSQAYDNQRRIQFAAPHDDNEHEIAGLFRSKELIETVRFDLAMAGGVVELDWMRIYRTDLP